MSTQPVIVSKGEKGKSKYQSLDINSLYRVSRGESLEQHQQKSTLPRKHGMQSLGKVPSARRPPANLPSLKSETSSGDPAVSLVPSGGGGWATTKDPASSVTNTVATSTSSDNNTNLPSTQCMTGTAPASTPTSSPGQLQGTPQSHPLETGNKSSWSAIMSRPGDTGGPGIQQQSQQNREINAQYGPGPSLRPQTEGSWIQGGSRTASGTGSGAAGAGSGNIQGAPGPQVAGAGAEGTSGGRPNLAQSPGMGLGQAGPQQQNQSSASTHQVAPNMHHYRGLIPQFMCRGNFQGNFPAQMQTNSGSGGSRPRANYLSERFSPPQRQDRDRIVEEEIISRPIIKEEDLTRMDDISRDAGWTAQDEIDYNQKLAFSDEEENDQDKSSTQQQPPSKEEKKDLKEEKNEKNAFAPRSNLDERDDRDNKQRDNRESKDQTNNQQPPVRSWSQAQVPRDFRGPPGPGGYPSPPHPQQQQQMRMAYPVKGVEDEDIWMQRRKEQGEKVQSAVVRARIRKEQEEKRYQEKTQQAAAKKLQELDQKIAQKEKNNLKEDESVSTGVSDDQRSAKGTSLINVPPVQIPVPEWERERESRERSRTSSESKDDKAVRDRSAGEFRGGERGSFGGRERDRELRGEREQPGYYRSFQSNLPPRFQKQQQQAERAAATYNRVSPNAERPAVSQQPLSFSQQYDPSRWAHNNHSFPLSNSSKSSHQMTPPARRNRMDWDVTDDERPLSRDHRCPLPSREPPQSKDDRYRHSMHRPSANENRKSDAHYDDYRYKDYEYDDRHSSDSWERERERERDRDGHYDKADSRDLRDNRDRDNRDARDNRENRDRDNRDREPRENRDIIRDRDIREKKDYDGYSKSPAQQELFDDRESERRDSESRRVEAPLDNRREVLPVKDDRLERSERPQRPDSRDSRTSRDSRASLRDDDASTGGFHKSGSWANDFSDYEDKKRDAFVERDRRQPPGPVTRDKLEADELKPEKRNNLTQLKRATADQEKKDLNKDSPVEPKKEDAWARQKLERNDKTESSPKAWADASSPTFEKDEEKLETIKDQDQDVAEMKRSMEKLNIDKREEVIDEGKEDKKEKRVFKNRSKGIRQWNSLNVYGQRWSGQESRGRRGGSSRLSARPSSGRSGSYGHTDSEMSGDEISGATTEPGKDDRRSARSPKPASAQKGEKDERNREASRRDEKRSGEYSQGRGDKNRYDGNRSSREGFAPSGEPSRRGRGGGFRIRGATAGGRMEGYGPPPSKSPFSTERESDEKSSSGLPNSTTPTPTQDNDINANAVPQTESVDDKIIAKQQALTAGITGRHTKPSAQSGGTGKHDSNHAGGMHSSSMSRSGMRKDDSRSKRTRSGSRRGRDSLHRFRSSNTALPKQNTDVGNEDWETTSENSEEHPDIVKEQRNPRNRRISGRNQSVSTGGVNASGPGSRRDQPSREMRDKSKSSLSSSRAPGAEKRGSQGASFGGQRQNQNTSAPSGGRSRNQCSSVLLKNSNKDNLVNRVDEIKLNDQNAVTDVMNKKNKDKRDENESNNEEVNSNEDKIDADGFQEVRSKKNVKDKKEEPKPRKDKESRDRSKSKMNQNQQSAPAPAATQTQNIPPLLGQPVAPAAGLPAKQFQRPTSRQKLLAPRFQKQQANKLQQQQEDKGSAPAPPPSVNAWDKPFTSQLRAQSPASQATTESAQYSAQIATEHAHDTQEQTAGSATSSHRNSPNAVLDKSGKCATPKEGAADVKNVNDASSPPVQTLIFENTNYTKTSKSGAEMQNKNKYSGHIKSQQRADKRSSELDEEGGVQISSQQQQVLSVAFTKPQQELIKDKAQEPIQMPLTFGKSEDNADMKLDFPFDPSELSQFTEDKSKSLSMTRSIHMTGQSTISPSTAELNLKIASVKKVWENPTMPTVVEHEDGGVVNSANSFPQAFESNDVEDSYASHQQYSQNNMKNEISTSTNVCKLVPPQVKPQQQSSGSSNAQTGSAVPGPSPIGPGQSPIGHPPASLQGPISPPPFNSTGQPSHINYQEFAQYPGSQAAAQYGSMSAIPSPPGVLYNTGSGQLQAQAGGLYGAFQMDQSRSPFTQYQAYGPSLQNSFNQQSLYLQQPPPHAPNAPTPDMYQSNISQYRITAATAPPFGQNQQMGNNPNTVLISSSSNSLMSGSVKPSSQPIGAIGTKAPHFQAPSAPQPNQLAYIPYDPNQVLGVSGSYMGNSQLVQRPGPTVQPSANSYYNATSSDVFPGSQTGFYQPGGAAQQTGTHYGLQGFGQHSQNLATGSGAPVNLQNFGSQFLSSSGLQIAAAAAAQQYRNPTGGLPGPANAAANFLSKHQQQEQPRQLKSPSGNQQDIITSVFSSPSQIPSPKSRKQQTPSQQPQPSPTQHHKYQQYQGVNQTALNVRGMGMPPRAGIQSTQQRYPPPIQRPVVPFPPGGPNPNAAQQQGNCMPSQQQQQMQISRHRSNLHQQQQQQQRNMKMQQQYYAGQANVKMETNDKVDSHSEKIADSNATNQSSNAKSAVSQQDSDTKEEVNQQTE